MKGRRIRYIRVNPYEQNFEHQLDGENPDRIFIDKASSKDKKCPQLKELIQFVRDGDMVIIYSMNHLARNLDDLRRLVKSLTEKGVVIQFKKEGLTFTGEDSPSSNLLLSVMGACAEFEKNLSKERQQEGIELAKKRGVYRGRKRALSDDKVILLKERIAKGETKTHLAKEFGISRETLYQYIKIE